jgi:hypothetical protein
VRFSLPTVTTSCDYHRITDVGSGGKLSRGENIGRFGIGFVSTYQVTDHPEIRSSGVKLTLHPEEGQWFIEPFEATRRHHFLLALGETIPIPRLDLRLGCRTSAPHTLISSSRIFRRSFVRACCSSGMSGRQKCGEMVNCCWLATWNAWDGSDLIVSFRPSGEVEQWHILRADAAESAARLYASHPRLESLGRGTKISIGLRIDPEPLAEGVLYAFLPTEQSTGLPMHINADFFPESDRKAVIFAGHQHEQAWNEMLIDAAATELARDPEGLLKMLGDVQFWQIMARAFDLSKPSNHPTCFKRFWERMLATASARHALLLHRMGVFTCPSGVFFPDKALNSAQVSALKEIGGRVVVRGFAAVQDGHQSIGRPNSDV